MGGVSDDAPEGKRQTGDLGRQMDRNLELVSDRHRRGFQRDYEAYRDSLDASELGWEEKRRLLTAWLEERGLPTE